LADFSGYLAADELYDGPFCVLSAVDGPNQHRLRYEVLDHDPDHDDIRRFLGRLKEAITARGGTVRGITTDGSPLYPEPLAEIFPDVPHQVCESHILKELTKAVLHVAARIRKQLAAQAPKLPRGRPSNTPEARRQRRRSQTIKRRVAELFKHRYLFVRHRLTTAERATLRRLSRGERRLQALRAIMDEVYRLFDRRCRTQTALKKLQRLRRRVRRFTKLGKSLDKLKDVIRAKTIRTHGHCLSSIITKLNRTLRGWFGYFRHCHQNVFRDLDRWLRGRLRSILRRRTKRRGRARGADHQRWPNAYFAVRGLYSLLTNHGQLRQSLVG